MLHKWLVYVRAIVISQRQHCSTVLFKARNIQLLCNTNLVDWFEFNQTSKSFANLNASKSTEYKPVKQEVSHTMTFPIWSKWGFPTLCEASNHYNDNKRITFQNVMSQVFPPKTINSIGGATCLIVSIVREYILVIDSFCFCTYTLRKVLPSIGQKFSSTQLI